MTVEFEALCDMAGEDAEATEIVREAICDTKKTIIERLKNKEKQNDTEKGTQKEMETSVEIAISQDTTVNPLTDSGTLQGEANFNILNTPCSTNQSTTNCIKDPPIKKKRGRPQTTCYLPSGQKGRHKDSQAAPTVSGKGKGKLKNNNGKAKPKANEQGASYFQSDGPPSKLKVTRASKSVSFSNQQEDMCTGTDSDDFLCRSNLFYEDTLQC